MEKQQRIEELQRIKSDPNTIIKTGITIRYAGDLKTFTTHKIPLECLIYNKYNGRIGAAIKSYEKQFRQLSSDIEEDKKIIENFLWESKADRNKKTMHSLATDHQLIYGVVTKDGIIVDGNRRAMLLNKNYKEREDWQRQGINVDHCKYFEAIILDEEFGTKEIMKLETVLQMGQDEKLDFNPIEKYLKCQDLINVKYEVSDIADMMGERESEIKKYLSTLKTMETYLHSLHYDGIYTRLERREDQCISLNKYITSYKNNRGIADWPYEDFDVSELEQIAYDYIRANYEGKDFRKLFQDFFTNKETWNAFKNRHTETMKIVTDSLQEEAVDDIRIENPEEDLSKLLEIRDENFKQSAIDGLTTNFGFATYLSLTKKEIEQPLTLLTKSLEAIEKVDTDSEGFNESGVYEKIVAINKKSFELKKLFD